ncbi:MAG: aldo/keto reductase [Planctomycetota bacterium]
MRVRSLGATGISISAVSFGAGPVSGLMTERKARRDRVETIRRAIEAGINWFDTAATYGDGESERALGLALLELRAQSRVHVATKVRLMPDELDDVRQNVKISVRASLERLRLDRMTLIQLHNSITRRRGDQHTSITPADVLGPGGVLDAFQDLKSEGIVRHFGLTGLGDMDSVREVVRCGEFETMQVCYNILNPSAARRMPASFDGEDYGEIMRECAERTMGVIAIRVYAGGALTGQPPSAHTRRTRFFPLDLYERDMQRALLLAGRLPPGVSTREVALRFALSNPDVSTALIGFAGPQQIAEAVRFAEAGPLPPELAAQLGKTD